MVWHGRIAVVDDDEFVLLPGISFHSFENHRNDSASYNLYIVGCNKKWNKIKIDVAIR